MSKIIIIIIITTLPLFAQILDFTDDFEDGVLTGWNISEEHQRTYELSEESGVLKINYHRNSNSWEWDTFTLTLPQNVDVSDNPKITIEIKSDVSTVFTIKPHYTNGNSGWIQKDISADNIWRLYSFDLSESNYSNGYINRMAFYFDGGTTSLKSGTIYFDNFKIAGYSIEVKNLQGEVIDSSRIDLSWNCNDIQVVDHFNIYRGLQSGFPANTQTKIGDTPATTFKDIGLSNNTTYYYLVTAVDTTNKEHPPSNEARIRISTPGVAPSVKVITTNGDKIGKYEKFELKLELKDATYQNPYNPDEIKLYAYFKSPDGDTTWVNGFYDNYQDIDEWKIRFSPDVSGDWEYCVYVSDIDGTGSSEKSHFTVIESEHHGWLQVSPDNPHYLICDDGTSFYGVGVYYYTRVTESGLDNLVDNGANFFAYWNGNYDYEGGRHQIESARTGIGYYDQDKCGRVDEIIQWAEARDLKTQFAIWPHDVLDETVWGYNGWEYNAFKYVCAAKDFYSDSTSWEYQKKLYRYIIARWGYSRSLAVWELVNEIHGTDGWVHGNQGKALEWVQKIHNYFKDNDPYKRPTTIDKGRYWPDAYEICDMPNVHLYEEHWQPKFPDNPVRSSYWTYRNVANQFYTDFEKPGIMAEAGGENHFYADIERGTEEYTLIYHNALWASWSGGLAITPLWWWYDWLREEDLDQLHVFSTVAKNINYAQLDSLQPAELTVENADGFFMESDTMGFGWIRAVNNNQIEGNDMSINGLSTGTFQLSWINTWTGDTLDSDTTVSVENIMPGSVTNELHEEDVALFVNKIENGFDADIINLFLERNKITYYGGYRGLELLDSIDYNLACYITDNKGRLATFFNKNIEFTLEGAGRLEKTSANAYQGGVVIDYYSDSVGGQVTITANADGLNPAILTTQVIADINEDQFHSDNLKRFILHDNYPNPFNSVTNIKYYLPQASHVEISLYDINGRLVTNLVDGQKFAGEHITTWNSENHSSGIYLYKIKAGDYYDVKKCALIK